ncbi:MAG TPA: DUF2752 domain-containing protein [Acidisarcina sp.]|nr:DUF2752 domain-containing protein [Acidisarcina sp.]
MEIYLLPAWLFHWLGDRGLSDPRLRMHLGYFLSNLLVLALLPLVHLLPHLCLLKAVIGIPCPGCGVTHALLLAMSSRFRESMMANPAGLAIAATIAFQLIARPIAMAHLSASAFVDRASCWLGRIAVAALMTAWISTLMHHAM